MRTRSSRLWRGVLLATMALMLAPGGMTSGARTTPASPPLGPASLPADLAVFAPQTPATSVSTTVDWINVTQGTAPSARQLAAVTYDAADGYVLLFGGGIHRLAVCYGDTWTYQGGNWTQLHPTVSPPARIGAGMVYDAHDGYVLLFGGYNETTGAFLNDTWKFAHGNWTELFPSQAPSGRWLFGFTYDPMLGGAVLYGGGSFTPLGETWIFADGQWKLASPTGSTPPWRSDTALDYDPADGESVLFGGNGNSSVLSDTWALTGNNSSTQWQMVSTPVHPPAEGDFGLAFDSEMGRLVLASSASSATWTFEAGGWINVTGDTPSTYSYRNHFSLTDDPRDGYLLLTEGSSATTFLSDTWALDGFEVEPILPRSNPGEVEVTAGFTTGTSGGFPPYAYAWTFGNSGLSDLAAPVVNFSSPGVFNVSVLVTDAEGVSATGSLSYTVVARLSAVVQSPRNTTDAGRPLTLTGSSSGGVPPVAFHWQLPGGINESEATVTVVLPDAGNYDLNLTATDSLGAEYNVTFGSSVAPDPTPLLTESATSIAPGAALSVRASVVGGLAPYRYAWSFGDGTGGSGASTTHSYATVGSYRITVTVNDSAGFVANASTVVRVANQSAGLWGIGTLGVEIIALTAVGLMVLVAVVWVIRRRRVRPPEPPGTSP